MSKTHVSSMEDVIRFGKYKDLTVEELLYTDHHYVKWLIKNDVVTFSKDILEYLNSEISKLHLQGYNESSSDEWGGFNSADDDPFYGLNPH